MVTAPSTAPPTAVAGLSDDQLLALAGKLALLDRQVQVFLIDHLLEIDARALYLRRGFSSLFDYVTRGLGYSDGAAYRRVGAMKLCAQVAGTRERLQDGSLTLDAAAQLQSAFDRRDRQRRRATRDVGPADRAGSAPKAMVAAEPAIRADGSATTAPATAPPPELDLSARQALVDEAVGKSSREVMRMLAGVDPELAAPADRLRPLDAERWELKAVIDTECQRGLEQLKGLLSHVDPRMTLGQLVGRLVKEGLDRHDPGRPPRRARHAAGSRSESAERTSAPEQEVRPAGDADRARNRSAIHAGAAASTAKLRAASACNSTSAPEPPREPQAHASSAMRRPAPTGTPPPAPEPLRDTKAPRPLAMQPASLPSAPKTQDAKAQAPSKNERSARSAGATASAATSRTCGRAIPAAVRREIWQRDGGRCSYVDPRTGRRCASRHLLEIDHRIPYARGGGAKRANLRLLCSAHHRQRHRHCHADHRSASEPAG